MQEYVIGVDLGGTQIRAIVADRAGQVYAQVQVPTAATQGPDAVIERIAGCIEQMRVAVPDDGPLRGVGVGSPGPLDPYEGVVLHANNLPGWINVPLRDKLAQQTRLPVVLGNDANAAVLAEWIFGGGRGCTHVVYITVSTGIGAGVIMDGRLLLGRKGAGTELGHMLIDSTAFRSWEDLASGTALAATARAAMLTTPESLLHRLTVPATLNAAVVAQAAQEGDSLAVRLLERQAVLLGLGFVNTLHLFSPEIILVGGSVVTANPWLLEGAQRIVQQYAVANVYRSVPIEVAHLGAQVGTLGAAALMWYASTQ